jgi:hypothetical protein
MGTLQLTAGTPRLGVFSAQARVSGRQYDDDANAFLLHGFFSLNLYASHTFAQRFQVFASGENIFDRSIQAGRTPVLTLATPRAGRIGLDILLSHSR